MLAAFVLTLAGCGDDNSSNDSAQNTVRTEPLPPAAQGRTGDEPPLDLENNQPAPKKRPKQHQSVPQEPQSKALRESAQKQVYETSKFFCRTAGVTGLRREYNIPDADDEAIAREAAQRTYSRGDSGAVYAGCLAGLRESAK